ncbi:MAG: peptide chain release factor N(5)-glutamine methyltransferase [Bacteroidetes bacterium]|nr:peptide chain release factor N(5)-glutamine methyltransferase [Bacteroidota bacterium]
MAEKLSTLLDILNYSAGMLAEKGIKDARLNVELLFANVLSCSRLDLYLNFEKPLNQKEISEFKTLLRRRLSNEPLQYITGSTNFFGYEIDVNPDVLIPRPDTEVLVERFLERVKGKDNFNILEIGTGSGCIAVSVIKELEKAGNNFKYTGIENNDKAVDITLSNLHKNKADSSHYVMLKRDFLSEGYSFEKIEIETGLRYDFVISNPPYISADEFEKLDDEVRKFEPAEALTDGRDGLVFYGKLLEIKKGCEAFLEIAYNRKEKLTGLLETANINDYEFFKDYGGNYRVLRFKR